MEETKLKRGQLEVYHKSFNDIRICPLDNRSVTVATMGGWSDKYRDELLAYAELFATAPELLKTLTDLIPYINECEMAKQIYRTQAQAIREVVTAAIAKAEPQ